MTGAVGGGDGGIGTGEGAGGAGITALVENCVLVEIAINKLSLAFLTELLVSRIAKFNEIVDSFRQIITEEINDYDLICRIHSVINELDLHPDSVRDFGLTRRPCIVDLSFDESQS
jgi:hypothetical protein